MAKAKRMIKRKNNNTETSQRRHEAEPKKRKSKFMFLLKILTILAIIVGVFFLFETKIGIEPQVAENIEEQRIFENLTIKNINVKYENGNSYFKLELVNESDTLFTERNIKIIFKNPDGTEYAQIKYNLSDININETFYINTSTNIDLTKASDFVIESE